jgi:hypothetical protein
MGGTNPRMTIWNRIQTFMCDEPRTIGFSTGRLIAPWTIRT